MTDEIQAKNLIESGASLHEISGCFGSSLDAYGCYAEAMHNRFSFDQAAQATQCAWCGSAAQSQSREITWRAVVHDKSSGAAAVVLLLLGGLTSRNVQVQFTTTHRYCQPCAGKLWQRISLIRLGKTLLFAALITALFITVPLVLISCVLVYEGISAREFKTLGPYLAASLLALYLIYRGFRWLWTSAVPQHLQFIGRFPFELVSARKV